MKRVGFVLAFIFITTFCLAQISGTTPVTPGQTVSYTYYGNAVYGYYNWSISPYYGSVQSQSSSGTTYYVTILWNTTGTCTLSFSGYGQLKATMSISINCPSVTTPSTSFTYSSNTCGDKVITRTTNPPAGVNWYWQTTSSGTSESYPSNTFSVSSSGTYYLRAKVACSPTWSSAQSTSSVTVTPTPPDPAAPSATGNGCGPQTLSFNGSPPGGVTWYWQGTNSAGTSTANSSSTYSATVNGYNTYYLRAYSGGCWSNPVSVGATVAPIAQIPYATLTVSNNSCGSKSITISGTPPPNEVWHWQDTNPSGTTINSNTSQTAYSTGTYYLRSLYMTSGCWSTSSQSVYITVNPIPADPGVPTTTNNSCGPQILSFNGSPPGGVTWYWQDTNANGTSTANSSSTYTAAVNGNNTYYLRAYSGGCWSSSVSVSSTVAPIAQTPYATLTVSTNTCGSKTVTISGTPPANEAWHWQSTNPSGTTINSNPSQTVNATGTYYLRSLYMTSGCWSASSQSIAITVNDPPAPDNPSTTSNSCGNQTLSKNGTPPGNVSWYWQGTNSSGTDDTSPNAIGTTFQATISGTYYLRARNTLGCWSPTSASIVVSVNVIPTAPAIPSVTSNTCGPKTLTRTNPADGSVWYWQGTVSGGISQADPASSYTATIPGTNLYFIRALKNGCWSAQTQISVTVNSIPTAPPIPAATNNTCGSKIIVKPVAPGGVTFFWQGTNSNNTDYTSPTAISATFDAATSANYYIRAKTNGVDCWSNSTPITLDVDPVNISISVYDENNSQAQATSTIKLTPGFVVPAGKPFSAKIVISAECNNLVNWVEQTVFDETGTPISMSRSYSDGFGNPLESQSKDFLNNKVFGSQTLFNSYGVAVAGSMAAPIQETDFIYKKNLASNAAGQPYGAADFDLRTLGATTGEINNPKPFGAQPGTVGWYYSSSNTLEPLTPTTQFPYARSFTAEGPDPTVTTSAGPGDQHRMGSGHESKSERLLITTGELNHYFSLRPQFPNANQTNPTNLGYKYISTDPNGKRAVSFVDADGHSLASATITSTGNAPFTYDNWSYTYYNDMGQVVATVAPKGVNTGSTALPNFVTYFKYDQLGRMIETTSIDEGTSQFVYALDGRIRFSENQVQRAATPKRFSYTNYDNLGRLIESGEYSSTAGGYVFQPHSVAPSGLSVLNILENNFSVPIDQVAAANYTGVSKKLDATRCTDHSFITYDRPGTGSPATQNNLYGQISKTENENATTWYSYDEFGQLEWTKQNIVGLGIKTVDYTYDYFGNIMQVAYQTGQADKFYHHYVYDLNQRLSEVYTSLDGTNKTLHAKYIYYLHGPLKRVELANNLQGIDYVYTINGALKSINHSDVAKDPGGDGSNGFSTDVFGQVFDYYDNDYTGAGYSAGSVTTTGLTNQYNGLIKDISWVTPVDNMTARKVYGYTYDNLYQLQNAQFGTLSGVAGNYTATLSANNYNEQIPAYDKNGNIQSLLRKSKTGTSIGNYAYNYQTNTNKVSTITNGGAAMMSYNYNAIGQMIQQVEGSNTMNVTYNAYGLTKEVRNASNQLMVSYGYDDRGDRVKKLTYVGGNLNTTTYYVHDASGNELAIYQQTPAPFIITDLLEVPIYGAGRLGIYKPGKAATFYEINDHLGNVRAVIGPPKTDVYTATMESENPMVSIDEDTKFNNTIAPRIVSTAANNTPGGNEAIRINNGQPNGGYAGRMVGPGIKLKVAPGDVITAEVWGYHEGGTGYSNTLATTAVAGAVATLFGGVSGAAGDPGKTYSAFNQVYTGGGYSGAAGSGNDDIPAGYLNLVMFNNDLLPNPTELPMAAIPITAGAFTKQKLTIGPINIPAPGYVYIYVNDNSNSPNWVYFDDLKITHVHSPFVSGADFYPFGLTMSDREILTEPYRYGYQGQYAEEDSETGWNAFELRMYDARFGRWLSPDPYGQYASPYLGMGNNPVSGTDPDGGLCCGPGFVEGLWNSTRLLDAIVVTPTKSFVGAAARAALPGLVSAGFDAAYNEMSSSLTFEQYQIKYPEFLGMSHSEATEHWNNKYSTQYYKEWNESVRIEKIISAQEKIDHWSGAMGSTLMLSNAGRISGPALRPKTFSYNPRGIKNTIPEGKAGNHLFKGVRGDFKLGDTPGNRKLIFELANNKSNFVAKDKFGKSYYAKTLDDGSELFAYTQGGIIKGAGMNPHPMIRTRIQY